MSVYRPTPGADEARSLMFARLLDKAAANVADLLSLDPGAVAEARGVVGSESATVNHLGLTLEPSLQQ